MNTTAVILAGGVGKRMGADRPKQFLEIRGKPIIAHTIENFQRNSNVDAVVVVCVEDWIGRLEGIVAEYGLDKVEAIVPGGETSHDSTRNGMFFFRGRLGEGDYVIIHDAARPIFPQAAIDEMMRVAREHGNASLAIPCYETIIYTEDQLSGVKELDRNSLMRVQTPQAYGYNDLLSLYDRAESEDQHDFIYADILYLLYDRLGYF